MISKHNLVIFFSNKYKIDKNKLTFNRDNVNSWNTFQTTENKRT